MAMPDSIGMKLHTALEDDGVRIAEFYPWGTDDFEVGVADNATLDKPKINAVHLTRRELKALRHWIDAVLNDA